MYNVRISNAWYINIFESLLTLDVDEIRSSIVQTPKYLNPRVLKNDLEEHIIEDIERAYNLKLTTSAHNALTKIKTYFEK